MRAAGEQRALEVRADHVVGRRDERRRGRRRPRDRIGARETGGCRARIPLDADSGCSSARGARTTQSGPGRLHRTIGAVGRPPEGAATAEDWMQALQLFRPPARRCSDPSPASSRPGARLTRPSRLAPGRIAGLLAAIAVLAAVLLIPAAPASAADGLKMDAHALIQGHVRAGSWFGIAVDLENDGPTVAGELRISGGADSRTRFGTPVELATGSRKEYLLYALPPTFGGNMTVELVSGSAGRRQVQGRDRAPRPDPARRRPRGREPGAARRAARPAAEPERPGTGHRPARPPATCPSASRPGRPLDRLIWQDVDAASPDAGPARGAADMDRRRRPPRDRRRHGARGRRCRRSPTTCSPTGRPASSTSTPRPAAAARPAPRRRDAVTGPRGDPGTGRTLAMSGDRVDRGGPAFGSGAVTLLGFDPATRGSRTATRSTSRSGAASCRPDRAARSRSSTTRPSSARSPTCRASRCRRSAPCSSCCWATSCSSAP